MIVPRQRIEEARDKEKDARRGLAFVHLDAKKSRLEASDGKILAVVPVEGCEGDTSGPVTAEALKMARSVNKGHVIGISANGTLKLDTGAEFPRPEAPTFPDVDRVTPDPAHARILLGINPELLRRLHLAIAENASAQPYLALYISPDQDGVVRRGIHVRVAGKSYGSEARGVETGDAYGVQMPVPVAWPDEHPQAVRAREREAKRKAREA